MPEERTELQIFLDNISKGLSQMSVKQLNDVVITALNKKEDINPEIDYVLTIVTNDFCITKTALMTGNARGTLQDAKQISYCLLHFVLGLSTYYISANIFNNWQNSVSKGIQRFNKANPEKIKDDRDFIEKYNPLRDKLIQYIAQR